jgi:hypothetical protein
MLPDSMRCPRQGQRRLCLEPALELDRRRRAYPVQTRPEHHRLEQARVDVLAHLAPADTPIAGKFIGADERRGMAGEISDGQAVPPE